MGRIEHSHVLHVIVHVPWVRFDEVKAVVHDDPADLVILGLGAVVLVALASVIVHSCIAVASSSLNRLNFHRFGIRACACSTCYSTPTYLAVGVRLLGNNAAIHTRKLGLDPPVIARVTVASVENF